MRHTTLGTFLSLSLIFLFFGCTNVSEPAVTGASLLAYWGNGANAIDCSGGIEQCVGFARNKNGLWKLVAAKRGQYLELVKLDGYGTQSSTYYAGAWQASLVHHLYEPEIPITAFEDHHQQHVDNGEMLLNMAVWWNGHQYRIAAVWKPRGAGDPTEPARIFVDLSWKKLKEKIADFETQNTSSPVTKYYLDEIEVYKALPGDGVFVAAVWRPGDRRTELRWGPCEIATTPIHFDDEDFCPPHVEDEGGFAVDSCPLFDEVATLHTDYGLRPSDFEPYEQTGVMRLAVLLQDRGDADWLMVPGSFHAVHCRQQWLGNDESLNTLGLLDFDLMMPGSEGLHADPQIHNGLVHDGGTGGGNGGLSIAADPSNADAPAVASSGTEGSASPGPGGSDR